jgi:hypothetical protein
MKNEPKTPLQLRAENMLKEDEVLGATAPQPNIDIENAIPEEEEEAVERKEVLSLYFYNTFRMNPYFHFWKDIQENR